jgi:hypothetical protein
VPQKFDYTANEKINPFGSNQLAAFALYYQRSLYEDVIYPGAAARPIDLYYHKQLYGRVDRKQNTVVTSGPNLLPITAAEVPNLFAVGPVALAFANFVAHMRKGNVIGVLTNKGNPKLYDMKAYTAFTSPQQKYQAYLAGAYKVYRQTFTAAQNERVVGFSSFVKDYTGYLLNVATTYPVTQTNFILTPSVSPFATGLAIGIDKGNCADDHYKYVNYIADPNFTFYTKAAKKFGFLVDRNAPWILWADVFSEAFMVNFRYFYMDNSPEPITKDTFFEGFYTPTWHTDIPLLREAITTAYRSLVQSKPYAEIFPPRHVAAGVTEVVTACKLQKVNKLRPPLSETQVDAVLTDKTMIDFYIALRQAEARTSEVNPAEVRAYAYERYRNQLDSSLTKLENAVQYINSVYAKYVYTAQNLLTAFPAEMYQAHKRK